MGIIGRVTNNQISDNFLLDLGRNQRALAESQRTIASGKRIVQASDDPLGAAMAMRMRGEQARIATWQANIDDGITWAQSTDAALANANDIIQRVRDLAVQGANGTLSPMARGNIAVEIQQLRAQLVQVGNTNVDGRYLFAGTATDTAPFDPATFTATLPVSTGQIAREIGPGTVVTVNVTADQFSGPGGSVPDAFALLGQIALDLQNGDISAVSASLTDIDAHITNINALRAIEGGVQNRMEVARTQLTQTMIATTEHLSRVEDADMAQAITDLTSRETVLRAALSVGARLLPSSLVDFLRG